VDFYPSTTVTHHIITITIMYRRQDVRLISPRSLTTLRTCILSIYNFHHRAWICIPLFRLNMIARLVCVQILRSSATGR